MFIRRSFEEFSELHTDSAPQDARPDWVIDWRWLSTESESPSFPSERSLIGCGAWAKPKRRKPA
jgi:hypothetical protein